VHCRACHVREARFEPDITMRAPVALHAQPHIRSPFSDERPHQSSAFGGRAQEDETILGDGDICHGWRRFIRLDSPELIRPRRNAKTASGSFQDHALDHDALGCVSPEGDDQLARQSRDHCLLEASGALSDPLLKPLRQSSTRLMAQP
jgi:hypothetical protein